MGDELHTDGIADVTRPDDDADAVLRPAAPSRDLDDWIVLFDASTGSEVELLGAAVVVYRLIGTERRLGEVLDDVADLFPDAPEAVPQARAVLEDLVAKGLLRRGR